MSASLALREVYKDGGRRSLRFFAHDTHNNTHGADADEKSQTTRMTASAQSRMAISFRVFMYTPPQGVCGKSPHAVMGAFGVGQAKVTTVPVLPASASMALSREVMMAFLPGL